MSAIKKILSHLSSLSSEQKTITHQSEAICLMALSIFCNATNADDITLDMLACCNWETATRCKMYKHHYDSALSQPMDELRSKAHQSSFNASSWAMSFLLGDQSNCGHQVKSSSKLFHYMHLKRSQHGHTQCICQTFTTVFFIWCPYDTCSYQLQHDLPFLLVVFRQRKALG